MKVYFPRQLLVVLLAKSLAILCDSSFTVSRRSGLGHLLEVVVYERFQYKASTESISVVLGRWSFKVVAGGGSTVFVINRLNSHVR